MKILDSKFLRQTLGKYSTGVTVVTSTDDDGNLIVERDVSLRDDDLTDSTLPS